MKPARDAFSEGADAPSFLRAERRGSGGRPLVTIAIPTFNRANLLAQAITSALDQQGAPPFEVIVLDNDSAPASIETALAALPSSPEVDLRYFVNAANIGMFANWNRCMTLAQGEWITILNDDDVLRPDFLRQTMAIVTRRSDVDGLAGTVSILDRRPAAREEPEFGVGKKLWRHLIDQRFDRDGLSRVTPRTLFWGNEIGGATGLLFRRALGIALGGYQPDEWPSADYFFVARFAIKHKLYLMRETLAERGIGENESMRLETLIGFARRDQELRAMFLEDGYVPQRWRRLDATLVATMFDDSRKFWNVDFDPDVIAREFGRLPSPSSRRLRLARLLGRGF